MRRYLLDRSVQRFPGALIGGSPLRLFRVTPAGSAVIDAVAAGHPVGDSTLVTALIEAGAIHPDPDPAAPSRFHPSDVQIVMPVLAGDRRAIPALEPSRRAIVVDDASPIPVQGAAIRFERNRGPGAARNAGAALARTPLVAFVDADVELTDGWLDALLPHFDDPGVGLVAPRVMTPDDGAPPAAYEQHHSPLDLGDEPAPIRHGTRVSYVPAAAIVCRADAFRAIGGFDEALRVGEDVDLVWRLDAAGWRCRYEPRSVVHHASRRTWGEWVRQRITYGSSAAPLARRHRGALAPVRVSGWSAAAWSAVVIAAPPAGAVIGAGVAVMTAAALPPKLPDVPPRRAVSLAWRGNLAAGPQLANAVRRAWWPLLAVASVRSAAARRALTLSLAAARSPLRLFDDVAYSLGVWKGIVAERTLDPLVPDFTNWPGRRRRRTEGAEDYGPAT